MNIGHFIDKYGELFLVHREGQEFELRGLHADDDEPYLRFRPGADIRMGDRLTGTITRRKYEIVEVENDQVRGKLFQVKAFYERPNSRRMKTSSQSNQQPISINVGSMVNSSIQQASPGAIQTISLSLQHRESISEVVEAISAAIENLELDTTDENELATEVATIKAQLQSAKPKNSIISTCLDSAKSILIGAATKAATSAAGKLATELANQVTLLLPTLVG